MELCDLRTIRDLLGRHGFHFSKAMGQNFLIDPTVPRDIAEASGVDADSGVLEIGPGIGPLTVQLSRRAAKVTAVELDRTLLPVLAETLAECPNVTVISGDVMKLDLRALVAEQFPGLTPQVCANLPYNITTPVLTALVEAGCFDTVTVMIQREVALRICARPGTSACGAFSLFMQYYTEPSILFDVAPSSFHPAPKVTSSVLHCRMRKTPAVSPQDEAFFFRTVRGGFALRRKTLLNSLSSVFGTQLDKEAIREAIDVCGLPADIRGERLGLPEYAALADELLRRITAQ